MDSWSEDQFRRMIVSGGNGQWREYWELHGESNGGVDDDNEGNTDELRTQDATSTLRLKYESNAARAYREALTTKVTTPSSETDPEVISSNSTTSGIQDAAPVLLASLPDDVPPTLQETIDQLSPFVFSMITSSRVRRYWYIWGMVGISSAYEIHSRGKRLLLQSSISVTSSLPTLNPTVHGYMGTTTATAFQKYTMLKTNLYALGVLAVFAGIPYLLFRFGVTKIAKMVMNNRQSAYKSAKNLLLERIALGRAQRMERCDVYYPPVSLQGCIEERRAKCGLVFYPGALIDRAAYAPIATKLSEAGILVAIVNLEPHRFVPTLHNINLKEQVMRTIAHSMLLCEHGAWTVDKWALGGHSLGGHVALAAVANELSSTISTLVMWGVQSYPEGPNYLCKRLRDHTNVQVLVVNGSNDAIVSNTKYSGSDKFAIFEAKMPPRCHLPLAEALKKKDGYTLLVTVEGGNHAGCAHYGPQKMPVEDGVRTITLDEQQDRFARVTADFLLCSDARE
jgi:predicted alpha/beta-hydrolase family hydrolase